VNDQEHQRTDQPAYVLSYHRCVPNAHSDRALMYFHFTLQF